MPLPQVAAIAADCLQRDYLCGYVLRPDGSSSFVARVHFAATEGGNGQTWVVPIRGSCEAVTYQRPDDDTDAVVFPEDNTRYARVRRWRPALPCFSDEEEEPSPRRKSTSRKQQPVTPASACWPPAATLGPDRVPPAATFGPDCIPSQPDPQATFQAQEPQRLHAANRKGHAKAALPTLATQPIDLLALDKRLRDLVSARIYTQRRLNSSEREAFACHVASAVAGYSCSSVEERTACWLRFLAVPRVAVPAIRDQRRLRGARDLAADSRKRNLVGKEIRASAVAREGHLSKAAAILMREEHPAGTLDETRAALIALHPKGELPPRHNSDGVPTWVSVDITLLRTVVRRACRGSSPGPSGWTEELLDSSLELGSGCRNCCDDARPPQRGRR